MMYREDWLMKQIRSIIQMIAGLMLNKDITHYELKEDKIDTETDMLYKELIILLDSLRINEAEDLLFKHIKANNFNYLSVVGLFYSRLNELSDEQLELADFSREEIQSGLEDILKNFGLYVDN